MSGIAGGIGTYALLLETVGAVSRGQPAADGQLVLDGHRQGNRQEPRRL